MYNKEAKRRECRSDVWTYNPASEEWTEIKPEGVLFEPRRYHSACVVGKHLVVYGGVSGQQSYLSDLVALNLGNPQDKRSEYKNLYRWITVNTRGEKPGPLANHSCQLVLYPERYRTSGLISLTSLPELRFSRNKVQIGV